MRGIKIPKQDFALKMQGGFMRKRWVYLQDTMVHDLITQGRGTGLSHTFPGSPHRKKKEGESLVLIRM